MSGAVVVVLGPRTSGLLTASKMCYVAETQRLVQATSQRISRFVVIYAVAVAVLRRQLHQKWAMRAGSCDGLCVKPKGRALLASRGPRRGQTIRLLLTACPGQPDSQALALKHLL